VRHACSWRNQLASSIDDSRYYPIFSKMVRLYRLQYYPMTDICVLPDFTTEQATTIVQRLYGLGGTLKILNGERDLNYLLDTDSGRYVFKIANQDEPYGMLECQHQVLQRLLTDNVLQQQASSLRSVNGRVIEVITSESGINHYCRILNYVEGDLLSSINPQSTGLFYDLGNTLAQIDLSLQGFSHQALDRPLLWNMCDALTTLERFKPLLASDEKRNLIEYFESHFRNSVLPFTDDLRTGVIHNDANDNNVLVTLNPDSQQAIASIIDFGDMVISWFAAEPAIAAAYAMLGKDAPLDAAVAIIKGYHALLPLNEAEVSALFDFICMRLCMSVCICAHQRSIEPDNEYLSISEQPAWALLEKLKAISPEVAVDLFREACDINN
jgi:Ser/Thr protein kinase RdoA (MazF antagonist)